MKKILVTGAEGFIGSHLVEALLLDGHTVRAFVLYNSFSEIGWLSEVKSQGFDNLEIYFGDIRDPWSVAAAAKDIDEIFHLAALIAIPYSYLAPSSYIETNVSGTLNVLQAARLSRVNRILITSTSEVYGSAISVPIDEKHPRQGQSPYSASKIAADSLTESYIKSFDLPATIVRPFNTFGPRQSARAIIPTVITQLLNGETEIKLGSVTPTRDFNFVLDTVSGFLEIAKSDKTVGEEINIASGTEVSMGEVAQHLINLINPEARVIEDQLRVRPEKSEVNRLVGDNRKLLRLTDWTQRTSFDRGLQVTIDWFKDPRNLAKYDSAKYTI